MSFQPDHMLDIDDGTLVSGEPALQNAFRTAGAKPIVLHVHGGLVSRDAAIAAATHAIPFYSTAGAHAVFPVWRTGIWETLADTWVKIAAEALFRIIVDRVAGWAHAQIENVIEGSRGVPRRTLPPVTIDVMREAGEGEGDFDARFLHNLRIDERDLDDVELTEFEERAIRNALARDTDLKLEIDAALQTVVPARSEGSRDLDGVDPQPPKPTLADREVLLELAAEADTRSLGIGAAIKILKIIKEVLKRHKKKTNHGFHATVTEEVLRAFYIGSVGRTLWDDMKSDARKSFAAPGAAGSLLLRQLNAIPNDRQVTLVGHSAGAIFISELMKSAGAGLRPVDVVFLAPAVRCSLFNDGVISNAARVRNFRMFSMSDGLECKDTLVRDVPGLGDLTWFYPRSLLYFISGLLEKDVDADVLGLQRFHETTVWKANDADVTAARQFCAAAGRTSWAINGGTDPRMVTNSTRHGGFGAPGNGNTTMDAVGHLVRHGW